MSKRKINNFTQGYMCAVATLVNMNGEAGTREKELFDCCGNHDEKSLRDAGVDEYDINILKAHKLI